MCAYEIIRKRVATRSRNDTKALHEFGVRLRRIRLARGLTQEELAAQAGFSRSYYTEIETGKRNISLLNIVRLAECLHVPPAELLKEENK